MDVSPQRRLLALEEKAAQADENQRDQLTDEAKAARETLDDAIKADSAEILELWNEARSARSKKVRGVVYD